MREPEGSLFKFLALLVSRKRHGYDELDSRDRAARRAGFAFCPYTHHRNPARNPTPVLRRYRNVELDMPNWSALEGHSYVVAVARGIDGPPVRLQRCLRFRHTLNDFDECGFYEVLEIHPDPLCPLLSFEDRFRTVLLSYTSTGI